MAKKSKRSEASHTRKHLLDTFRYLTRSGPVGTYAKSLLTSCSMADRQLAGATEENWGLTMQPWTFSLNALHRGQQDCIEIVMGARINAARGLLVYQSIPVNIVIRPRCFAHDPPWCKHPHDAVSATATRRIHFDFDANVSKWPKHHLQVGGNPQELHQAGTYYYAVAEDPSEPRVPTPCLDLVLALDLVMREFDTGLELPQDAGWRKLVIRSEALCLEPYFARAHRHLQGVRDVPLIEHLSQ